MSYIFTSDWHAGEGMTPNTHSYLRPQPTNVMISGWLKMCRERIGEADTLVFLGDLGIILEDLKIYKKLPKCHKKILVMGDKEYNNKNFTKSEFLAFAQKIKIFDTIVESFVIEINGQTYYLSHKPVDCVEYCRSNNVAAICGHIHGIWRTSRMPNGQPIVNVGIDAWGGLVTEDFIIHQYNAITKGYYDRNAIPQEW